MRQIRDDKSTERAATLGNLAQRRLASQTRIAVDAE